MVARLFEEAARGRLELYVASTTLAELLYVASRIYEAAGVEEPNREALDLVDWVRARATVVAVDGPIALRAGELKKVLRIALPDCIVIAVAEAVGGAPVFRRLEREMEPVVGELRRLGVLFLDELEERLGWKTGSEA